MGRTQHHHIRPWFDIITSDRGSTSSHQTVVRHHHIRPWFDIITSDRGSTLSHQNVALNSPLIHGWRFVVWWELRATQRPAIIRNTTASYHPQYNGQLSSAIQRPAIIRNTTASYHPQYNGQLSSATQSSWQGKLAC